MDIFLVLVHEIIKLVFNASIISLFMNKSTLITYGLIKGKRYSVLVHMLYKVSISKILNMMIVPNFFTINVVYLVCDRIHIIPVMITVIQTLTDLIIQQ